MSIQQRDRTRMIKHYMPGALWSTSVYLQFVLTAHGETYNVYQRGAVIDYHFHSAELWVISETNVSMCSDEVTLA